MNWMHFPLVSCTTSPSGGRCTTSTWSFCGSCCAPSRRPRLPRETRSRPAGTSRKLPPCSRTRSTQAKARSPRRCARSTSTTSSSTAADAPLPPGHECPRLGMKVAPCTEEYAGCHGRTFERGSRVPALPVCRLLRLVEDAFDLQGDRDLLADDHAAAGNRAVVADAEVVPVDLGGRGEARARAAVGVGAEAVDLKLQRDRLGDGADGEVTVEQEVAAVAADAGGVERQRGVGLDFEEVGTADVVVAVRLAGVHRAQVDGGVDAGLQGVCGCDDGPLELVETTTDLAHHHVPDDERHLRVHRVDGPGPGYVAGDFHGCLGHHSSSSGSYSYATSLAYLTSLE